MTEPKRYLITSALPYANGLKHIGHLAGAYLPADVYARYQRAQEREVVFVCGSDEHGTAIPIQATKENTTPQAIIDKYHSKIEENFKDLNIKFDIYHRTSSPLHHETALAFFNEMNEKGLLTQQESEQYYDEEAKTFLADRYIKGTCPNCGYENAYGDQCEKCGKSLSPEELINPLSTISGNKPIKKATTHFYLPLQQYESFLREWILETHKTDWKANVVGQCKSWIDGGLQPRAVTRDLDWGVQLPNHPGKVLYVWFDAPIGYISATKQWAIDNNKNWEPYWKDSDTKMVHFIGKDNIVFHCIIFPAMLKALGYNLPNQVPANEFMNLEGDKMSTSRGWKLEMEDYINDFVKQENGGPAMADSLRYYLTAISPETKDSEFTWKGFQEAHNSELVAIFGNFINRTMVLLHKLCNGKVPPFHLSVKNQNDDALANQIIETKNKVTALLEKYSFRDAQFEVINLARAANKYMQDAEPWIKAKQVNAAGQIEAEAQEQIDNCIHLCVQLAANLAIFINPFLPHTALQICSQLKLSDRVLAWKNAGSLKLCSVGYSLRPPQLLFRKIEDTEVQVQIEKLKNMSEQKLQEAQATNATASAHAPIKPEIQFDDFSKLDLRIGIVTEAVKVPKADKLLQLTVDLGFETRTIVSGVAQHFTPEELVGKKVTVVVNLAPRTMRGVESKGMILMAENADGKLLLVNNNDAEAGNSIS
jgi:methionyl-tRNA synthetase